MARPQRSGGVLDEHDLFVVAHSLEDLFGLNQAARDLLPAAEPVLRSQPEQAEAPG
jgi:hypothetical protein